MGGWADALVDPKISKKANSKLWEKYGYGIETAKCQSAKDLHKNPGKLRKVSQMLTRNYDPDLAYKP